MQTRSDHPVALSPRLAVARRGTAAQAAGPGNGLGFFLFLLVNAALFVRPADVVPALLGVEIYQYLILACFAVSFPAILARLSPARLEKNPIDVCVLLLLPAVALSLFTRGDMSDLGTQCFAIFKILVYYLLFVSLVTSPGRLRVFIGCLIVFAAIVTLLSALDFHKVIHLPRQVTSTGASLVSDPNRMYGPGIFQDPNDVCVLIVTAAVLLVGMLADRRAGPARWLFLLVLPVLAYGFYLTQSRGGLLALLIGLGVLLRLRFGWFRACVLGVLGFPLLLWKLGARQTDLSVGTDTGVRRLWLWSDGLVMFRSNPIFGVGWTHYRDHAPQEAHNSFLQVLSETGLFGGALFLGAFFLALWGLYRFVRPVRGPRNQPVLPRIVDPDLAQLYPYLTGAVAAYAMGMMSLTLNELPTTYTILGMACVFQGMAVTQPAREPLRFDLMLPVRFVVLSLLFLAGIFVFIRLFATA
jgi:O-antigen ligase